MKMSFFEVEDWEEDYLRKTIQGHDLKFFRQHLTPEIISEVKDSDVLGVFIYSELNESVLKQFSNLKLIATMSTGVEHIDVDYCKKNNIIVANVPSYGENTVAEHAFALLLAISRKIIESVERTRKGDFSLEGLRGFDLKGKTIGVIGTGRIGYHVIKIARGFEMSVIAFDVNQNKELADKMDFSYVGLEELFEKSDVISFNVPLLPSTHHLLSMDSLQKLKKGVVIINTSRGGVIETNALFEGLKKGIIKAAGIDVLEEECFVKEERQLLSSQFQSTCDLKTILEEHILLNQDNVIITPHNAFNTKEALQRILDITIENIKKFTQPK
jgi:D-lactate dehydrogenase